MLKRKTDPESRKYWEFVERTAREVSTWPDWMFGGTGIRQERKVAKKKSVRTQFPETLFAHAEGVGAERVFISYEDVDGVANEAARLGAPIVTGVYELVRVVTIESQPVVKEIE